MDKPMRLRIIPRSKPQPLAWQLVLRVPVQLYPSQFPFKSSPKALRLLIRLHEQAEVGALRGKLKWEGDLEQQRLSRFEG
jgi:hypothetical protein